MAETPIEVGVKALLLSKSGITAHVSDRVYQDEAPQGQTADHLIYTQISDVSEDAFGGQSGLFRARIQVDAYSTSRTTAATLMKVIRNKSTGISDYSGTQASVVIDWVEYVTSGALPADDTNRPKLARYSGIWIFHYRVS